MEASATGGAVDNTRRMRASLERERKERQEREQAARGEKTSTLHRESDVAMESPDGPQRPTSRQPAATHTRAAVPGKKTDAPVRYGRSQRVHESAASGRGRKEVARHTVVEPVGEFERRLLNAKKLGKAPMPSVEQIPWFHPSVSRHIAESLLMHSDILDGTFLMRDSVSHCDSFTLSVRCHNAVRHYRVHWDGKQFCFGLGKFPDVESLEQHFRQQPMISGDSSVLVKLTYPYPRGVVEPHDYQDATEVEAVMDLECTMDLPPPSLSVNSKEGFLTKLGYHRKNWKIRWFSLYRNELKYFNTREDKTPLRVINLEEARNVERDESTGKPHCFRLVMPYRTFFMIASSDEEADDWVVVLQWRLQNNSR